MIDPFCLFYNNLNTYLPEENFWLKHYNSPKYHSWARYAFELICLNHIKHIKKALGISGIMVYTYSWQNENAQIDLILERADEVIMLAEIKYRQSPYAINKKYEMQLRTKFARFEEATKTRKAIWPIFISPFGLADTMYKLYFVENLSLAAFFKKQN
jgi:uncharacterized protein